MRARICAPVRFPLASRLIRMSVSLTSTSPPELSVKLPSSLSMMTPPSPSPHMSITWNCCARPGAEVQIVPRHGEARRARAEEHAQLARRRIVGVRDREGSRVRPAERNGAELERGARLREEKSRGATRLERRDADHREL